ncbi:hypothetical protein, partial [Pseudomonas viridiflava]|uniref:hypothetical protein n=1 Tax=Pseudomonas viridiflava TaxID=33069 RepID=UPI00197B32C8
LMAVARQQVPGVPWAFYVAGEQKRLLGQARFITIGQSTFPLAGLSRSVTKVRYIGGRQARVKRRWLAACTAGRTAQSGTG